MTHDFAGKFQGAADEGIRWTATSTRVVVLCFVINMIDGMDILLMSYLAPQIANTWQLPATSLGVVFSAGLVGMAIGGLLIAPMGDRHGRRRLILAAVLVMSGGMLAGGLSRDVGQLILARVVVGIGIGTALACMAALVAEFAPPRHRSLAVGILQAGYPIGATATGFLTAWALGHYDWQHLFWAASAISIIILPILWILLPESTAFLRRAQPTGGFEAADPSRVPGRTRIAIPDLLAPERRRDTLLLWAAVFFGFMVLYFIVSWIPRLAIEAGMDQTRGIFAGAIYNAGAFSGTVMVAWLADRFGLRRMISVAFFAAAALMVAFGTSNLPVAAVLTLAFALGVTLQGGFNGLYSLSTYVYPVEIRSTGLGWAMGLGRAGAVLGPLVGGYILSLNTGLMLLFGTFAVPLLIAGLCTRKISSGN